MNKKFFLFFFLFLFLLTFVSSQSVVQTLGAFKTGSCVTLKQTCGNCTFVNFTLSVPPNQTTFIFNQTMNRISPTLWTYNFCNTSINGEYVYDTYSDPNGITTPSPVDFFINPVGKILNNSQAILYFLVFFVAIIMFLISILGAIYLPGSNSRDQMSGYILAVENLKYFKMLLWAFSYLLLMLLTYFGWMISFGYLDLQFLGDLFNVAFYTLAVCLIPLFIVGVYIVIANAVRDHKIGVMLQMGLSVR